MAAVSSLVAIIWSCNQKASVLLSSIIKSGRERAFLILISHVVQNAREGDLCDLKYQITLSDKKMKDGDGVLLNKWMKMVLTNILLTLLWIWADQSHATGIVH